MFAPFSPLTCVRYDPTFFQIEPPSFCAITHGGDDPPCTVRALADEGGASSSRIFGSKWVPIPGSNNLPLVVPYDPGARTATLFHKADISRR